MLAPWAQRQRPPQPEGRSRLASTIVLGDTRLNQLTVRGFILFEMHVDGTRLYRRAELRVVAHARDVLWAGHRARLATRVRPS